MPAAALGVRAAVEGLEELVLLLGGDGGAVVVDAQLGAPVGLAEGDGDGAVRGAGLTLPAGMRWADVIVLGCAAAVGFTVALFISTVAFPPGPDLDNAKMGSLLSFSAIIITIIVAKILRVQRMRG